MKKKNMKKALAKIIEICYNKKALCILCIFKMMLSCLLEKGACA